MSAKVSGKDLQFWWGVSGALKEYPVESVSFDGAWEEIDTTDSSTESPSTDFIMNRAKRTLKVDAFLDAAHGATLVNNNLVLGTKYIVILGNVTETIDAHTYPVGKLFTSDGSGAATASNQVAALGAKLPGKSIVGNIASSAVGVTSIKYTEQYGEFDSTDSNSTGDSTETITGRVKRTSDIEMIMVDTTADAVEASPTAVAVILTFGSGLTITGSAIFNKKSIASLAKGDMVKVSYSMTWVGTPVSTLANLLDMGEMSSGTPQSFKVVWKGGGSTEKAVTGTAVATSMSIEADVNSVCKVSYGISVSGAVTENEYT